MSALIDLMILGADFQPAGIGAIVDDYSSFIWTDRYSSAGDFRLDVPISSQAYPYLVVGNYLSFPLSDSTMIIETAVKDPDKDYITCTGRSLEILFSNRAMFVNAGEDVFFGETYDLMMDVVRYRVQFPEYSYDSFPNYRTGNYVAGTPTIARGIEAGILYDYLTKVSEETSVGWRFQFHNYDAINLAANTLRYDIYMGADRTFNQNLLPAVVFSPELDTLTEVKTLESIADFKNIAYVDDEWVDGSITRRFRIVPAPGVSDIVSGIDRRVLVVTPSGFTKADYSDTDWLNIITGVALNELAQHNRVSYTTGLIREGEGFQYGIDYFLGDKVTSGTQTVLVTEHIWSIDPAGMKSYPTFKAVA